MTRSAPDLTLKYELSAADALAWEARPREVTGWGRAAFLLWLGLAGFALVLVPSDWVGPEGGWRFYLWLIGLIGMQWALAAVAMTAAAHIRSHRRVPKPVTVRTDIFPRQLVERRDLDDPVIITPDRIAGVLLYSGHVCIAAGHDVVIIPSRAFDDDGAMGSFAERWEALSRAAQA